MGIILNVTYAAAALAGMAAGAFVFRSGTGILKRKVVSEPDNSKLTTFMFSGTLRQTPLLEAIQFLEIQRREGVLHVYCGRRKGYLVFAEGAVIDGFWRNQTGGEAVINMFTLTEGDFYFEPKPINQPRLINNSAMDLMFEWEARKQSGWKPVD